MYVFEFSEHKKELLITKSIENMPGTIFEAATWYYLILSILRH